VRGGASAEGLFDFLSARPEQQPRQTPSQANFFTDPFGSTTAAPPPARLPQAAPARHFACGAATANIVDARGNDAVQMARLQPTKVFFGRPSMARFSGNGERYADSENAFAYRKALRRDCTVTATIPQASPRSI